MTGRQKPPIPARLTDGPTVLRVDASPRTAESQSRALADRLVRGLCAGRRDGRLIERDLATAPPPPVDAGWLQANTTPEAERTDDHRAALALSDALIAELEAADIIVIGLPLYNFGVPASLKAWIDQVCRARRTFAYGETGPVGLLENKRAVVVYVSGGTPMLSDIDFASGYMRHVLGFIGISDVTFVAADRHMSDPAALARAAADADDVVEEIASARAA